MTDDASVDRREESSARRNHQADALGLLHAASRGLVICSVVLALPALMLLGRTATVEGKAKVFWAIGALLVLPLLGVGYNRWRISP